MSDWAAWGTSLGTLVLAGATFAAVRSSSHAARVAERALLAGLRPVMMPSRTHDAAQQVLFADGRVFEVQGGRALVHHEDGVIYLATSLRNVGAGIAVLHRYRLEPEPEANVADDPLGRARHRRGDAAPDQATFAEQQRDLFIAAGDAGFWQAALRDTEAELHGRLREAIDTGGRVIVDLLYTDHEGGQPTITRLVLLPEDGDVWRCDVTRHWTLEE